MTGTPHVPVPYDDIRQICRKYHIRKLSLFGSVLRDDFGPESDIDILVEFEDGCTPGFFRLFAIREELSRAFGGKEIDLLTPQDLSCYFRDEVIAAAEVCYAEG